MRRAWAALAALVLAAAPLPAPAQTSPATPCGIHEIPSGVGLWFSLSSGPATPPFSSSYPHQLAYPLGDPTEPDYLLVPRDLRIEEREVSTCPACQGLGGVTCKHPIVIYSVASKLGSLPADTHAATLDGVTWIEAYNDADTPTVTYEEVVVRYGDSNFYRGGTTADAEVNATDIYSGVDVEYSLNRPGFFLAFAPTGSVTTTTLREGDKYFVQFLGYWLELRNVTDTGAQFVILDQSLSPVTILNLEYSSQPDGTVNKLFIYYDDLGGNRLSSPVRFGGQQVPMIFFLHVYRVDTDHDYLEVLLSSPWIDVQAFERVDLDGDGYPDVTDLEESWPSESQPSGFDWWIQYTSEGPYFVGYAILDGVRRGPFAVRAATWEPLGRIHGVTSYTWVYGDPVEVHDPVWYVVFENGTWGVGEEREYGGDVYALTAIEVVSVSPSETCCGMNCTSWGRFGIYRLVEGFCVPVGGCELQTSVGYLAISSTYSPRTLEVKSWSPGTHVAVRYCGCTYRSQEGAPPSTTPPPTPPPPPFRYVLSPSPADMEAALALASSRGASITSQVPADGDYVILGGPFAHELGAEAASRARVLFYREDGYLVMRVATIDQTWRVNGSDWGVRDYAVAFSYVDEAGNRVYAAMGLTRYGTRAAAIWLDSHCGWLTGGYGSVIEWRDYDGDGEVESSEVRQVARFPVSG